MWEQGGDCWSGGQEIQYNVQDSTNRVSTTTGGEGGGGDQENGGEKELGGNTEIYNK